MCGIAGIATSTTTSVDVDRLISMTAMLIHRGPGDRGVYVNPPRNVGLAHARLSIVDLAGGRQPISNGDSSLWITFNGEIFNHVELREELLKKGRRFRTESDTEESAPFAFSDDDSFQDRGIVDSTGILELV